MQADINLYTAQQSRALDQLIINEHGIPGFELMQRAALACFNIAYRLWPDSRNALVLCGTGNNGGDGYLIASLCKQHGLNVSVLQVGDIGCQKGDALTARKTLEKAGIALLPYQNPEAMNAIICKADIVYDALLGSGIDREVTSSWKEVILCVNQHRVPTIAVDIPSGLHTDTGAQLGICIEADATISFISKKRGLYSGYGPQARGKIYFDDLGVPRQIYSTLPADAMLLTAQCIAQMFPPRAKLAYKGSYGHALLVGGDVGMSGAIQLAAKAALRSGAGLVSVITQKEHVQATTQAQPELMCHAYPDAVNYQKLLGKVSAIAIGPGLGLARWGQMLFQRVLESKKIKIIDADALTCLAQNSSQNDHWILTPHPGEAARLLNTGVAQIQDDRFAAVAAIQHKYGGVCILKGAGSVIYDGQQYFVCPFGNPGMASGGMGDTLTGILVSIAAQAKRKRLSLMDIAAIGVTVHSLAGDRAARQGEHGMLASDLIAQIRSVLNAHG